jgi:hypothetical protein
MRQFNNQKLLKPSMSAVPYAPSALAIADDTSTRRLSATVVSGGLSRNASKKGRSGPAAEATEAGVHAGA